MSNKQNSKPVDYNGLMLANLAQVFGEHDADKRIKAINELYAQDAVLNEPDASAKGRAAINEAVASLSNSSAMMIMRTLLLFLVFIND